MIYLLKESCTTVWDPIDCSLPGSSVHGISRQEYRIGLSFPTPGSSRPKDQTCISWVFCIGRQILYHCTTWETLNWYRDCIQSTDQIVKYCHLIIKAFNQWTWDVFQIIYIIVCSFQSINFALLLLNTFLSSVSFLIPLYIELFSYFNFLMCIASI